MDSTEAEAGATCQNFSNDIEKYFVKMVCVHKKCAFSLVVPSSFHDFEGVIFLQDKKKTTHLV